MNLQRTNEYGQPIGPDVVGWTPRPQPPRTPMIGRYTRIETLDVDLHAADLYSEYSKAPDGRDWTYMFSGPYASIDEYTAWATAAAASVDPMHHAIIDTATGKAIGTAAYLRIDATHGVIEIGNIAYSPRLQRSPIATEAMFLFMRRVFDELGYRRYEWKCDHLNARSRAAALRYGFAFEGIFRQAVMYKGRSRDTAWFSIIDSEWPALRAAYEQWLEPANFADDGTQRVRLADCMAAARRLTRRSGGDSRSQ
jgi:RimJ/RimL family protein N-acetyltransferase